MVDAVDQMFFSECTMEQVGNRKRHMRDFVYLMPLRQTGTGYPDSRSCVEVVRPILVLP
mgnify:CR=1 FL=1